MESEHHQIRIIAAVLFAFSTFSLVSGGTQRFYLVKEDGSCSSSNLSALDAPAIEILPYEKTFPKSPVNCSFVWTSAPDSFISVRLNVWQDFDRWDALCYEFFKYKPWEGAVVTKYCGVNGTSEKFLDRWRDFHLSYETLPDALFSGWNFSLLITPYIMNNINEVCIEPPMTFRCLAGECIHHSLQCDTYYNCRLKFDESDRHCPLVPANTTTSAPTTTTKPVTTTKAVTTTKSSTTTKPVATTQSATTTKSTTTTTTEPPPTTTTTTTKSTEPADACAPTGKSPISLLTIQTKVQSVWVELGTIVSITAGPIVVCLCIIGLIVCGCRRRNARRSRSGVRSVQTSTEDFTKV